MTSNLAWQNDRLDRKAESALLRKYILAKLNERETTKRKRSFVLNLDAPWGSGKSFFLDNLANELSADGYLVAKVNAWIDDHSDDPLTSVVSAIDAIVGKKSSGPKSTSVNLQAIKRNAGKIVITAALGIGKKWVEKYLGEAVGSVAELASGSPLDETDADEIIMSGVSQASDQVWSDLSASMLKKFEIEQAAYSGFRQSFENLVSEMASANLKHAQIFVLIDELDRCRPSYAIQMLERIKHLFSISGAVFIVATDTSQLRESIKAVYGAKFDSERYLHRFFDREYRLEARNTPQFIEEKLRHIVDLAKLNLPKEESLADYVGQCAGRFKLSLRDTEQCIDMLADTIVVWEHKTKIEVAYLLPLLILKKIHPALLGRFEIGVLPQDDNGYLSNALDFRTSALDSGSNRLSAWQLFVGLHDRRSWNYEIVEKAAQDERRRDGSIGWLNHSVREELLTRLKDEGGDRNSISLLSTYSKIVHSISGFS